MAGIASLEGNEKAKAGRASRRHLIARGPENPRKRPLVALFITLQIDIDHCRALDGRSIVIGAEVRPNWREVSGANEKARREAGLSRKILPRCQALRHDAL
jgi:hypothetical protein